MIDLGGKHVFVVGGSRGIGAAAARMAAAAGAAVGIGYRAGAEAAEGVAARIRDAGGAASVHQHDVQDGESLRRAVAESVGRHGPLHGMVVSAGVFEHRTIAEMTPEFWNRVIGINLTGTMWSVKAAAEAMRSHGGGGSVVIYTSTAGQSGGGGGASAYCTSKAGQIVFMKSMAQELAADRIRVNCVAPAWTETDMAAPHIARIGRDKMAGGFPLGRIGHPDDVAGATCYLLSDVAAFVTGITLTVDGGMAMRG